MKLHYQWNICWCCFSDFHQGNGWGTCDAKLQFRDQNISVVFPKDLWAQCNALSSIFDLEIKPNEGRSWARDRILNIEEWRANIEKRAIHLNPSRILPRNLHPVPDSQDWQGITAFKKNMIPISWVETVIKSIWKMLCHIILMRRAAIYIAWS